MPAAEQDVGELVQTFLLMGKVGVPEFGGDDAQDARDRERIKQKDEDAVLTSDRHARRIQRAGTASRSSAVPKAGMSAEQPFGIAGALARDGRCGW